MNDSPFARPFQTADGKSFTKTKTKTKTSGSGGGEALEVFVATRVFVTFWEAGLAGNLRILRQK